MSLLVIVLIAGCNLRAPADATLESLPAATSSPTGSAPQPNNPDAETEDECIINESWPIYTVQPGDNLVAIAQFVGSTVEELTEANCLANPNRLDRGQELRVPNLPGQPSSSTGCAFTLGAGDGGVDFVVITPSESEGIDCYRLTANTTVTVAWPGAPPGTSSVEFLRMSAVLSRADVIGVDDNPADGFSIQWRVNVGTPPSVIYTLAATTSADQMSDPVGIYVP